MPCFLVPKHSEPKAAVCATGVYRSWSERLYPFAARLNNYTIAAYSISIRFILNQIKFAYGSISGIGKCCNMFCQDMQNNEQIINFKSCMAILKVHCRCHVSNLDSIFRLVCFMLQQKKCAHFKEYFKINCILIHDSL